MHRISLNDFLVFMAVAAACGVFVGAMLGLRVAAWLRGELD